MSTISTKRMRSAFPHLVIFWYAKINLIDLTL